MLYVNPCHTQTIDLAAIGQQDLIVNEDDYTINFDVTADPLCGTYSVDVSGPDLSPLVTFTDNDVTFDSLLGGALSGPDMDALFPGGAPITFTLTFEWDDYPVADYPLTESVYTFDVTLTNPCHTETITTNLFPSDLTLNVFDPAFSEGFEYSLLDICGPLQFTPSTDLAPVVTTTINAVDGTFDFLGLTDDTNIGLFEPIGTPSTQFLEVSSVEYPSIIPSVTDSFDITYENICHTATVDVTAPADQLLTVFDPALGTVPYTATISNPLCGDVLVTSDLLGSFFTFADA